MTVGSRRLAARCRERFVTEPTTLTGATEPAQSDPRRTTDAAEVENAMPQDNLDSAAT